MGPRGEEELGVIFSALVATDGIRLTAAVATAFLAKYLRLTNAALSDNTSLFIWVTVWFAVRCLDLQISLAVYMKRVVYKEIVELVVYNCRYYVKYIVTNGDALFVRTRTSRLVVHEIESFPSRKPPAARTKRSVITRS